MKNYVEPNLQKQNPMLQYSRVEEGFITKVRYRGERKPKMEVQNGEWFMVAFILWNRILNFVISEKNHRINV